MQKSWYDDPRLQAILKKKGFELLQFHQTEEWKALEVFGHHKNIMLTVTLALIAGGSAAVAGDKAISMLLGYLVPILVVIIRHFMIRFLDRYYARFLEAVVAQKKLRFVLGLSPETSPPFGTDKHLLVARRMDRPGVGPW